MSHLVQLARHAALSLQLAVRLSALAALTLPGCGGAEPPAPATAGAPAATSDPRLVCVQTFQRQRACADEFVPALVALRVKHDRPAGIAAADARDGREALVAAARAEWQEDSTDSAINDTCGELVSSMPAEQVSSLSGVSRRCVAESTCAGFVACISPVLEQHLR